jgi:hypothetical protein
MPELHAKIRPTPSNEYLANPHEGCCTFQRFNGDPLYPGMTWSEEGPTEFPSLASTNPTGYEFLPAGKLVTPGYLPTTVAYLRWFWRLMEPEDGRFDFSVLDKSLQLAQSRGQSVAIRLMPFGPARQPQLPDWYVAKYPTQKKIHYSEIDCPLHSSKEYIERWGGFIREAGRRYDGHPLIDTIDVSYAGPWGEGAGDCTQDRHHEFHQLWRDAWPTTPRLCAISDEQMIAGMAAGTGWRVDSFGDLGNGGNEFIPKHTSWNHHYNCYPRSICKFARDAWQKAPVHLEVGWVPLYWHDQGYDIDFILEQGLKFHATYFMPKSTRLPDAWMDKLSAFCQRLGYRFVLRQAIFNLDLRPGGPLDIQFWIDNVGVAPIYRPYQFALRLRHDEHVAIFPLADDIRTWLPGDNWVDVRLNIPRDFPRGRADLSAGIIDPRTQRIIVKFAVKERYSDGWTPLQPVTVE